MSTFSRPSVASLVLALALVTLAACGKKQAPEPVEAAEYVAIGDSYTAVSGAAPGADGCLRSDDDYPALVARAQGISDFRNASCGGATSANLTESYFVELTKHTNPPQLDAVSGRTRLVTMGIGMNDYGLSSYLITPCVPSVGGSTVTCDQVLKLPVAALDTAIKNMGLLVGRDIEEVRAKAPKARIVYVGYPRMLPETGECPAQIPAPAPALDRIRYALEQVNATLKATAAKAGADYIDTYALSEGHDMCSSDPWVNGQHNTAQALFFHPFPAYHQAVAAAIVKVLEQ